MKNTISIPFLKIIPVIIIFFTFSNITTAQNELGRVNLYTQFGAVPGLEATVNVEMRLYSGNKVTWYGRAGGGFGGVLIATGGPGGLAAITMLTGKNNNHFELNGGIFIGHDEYYNDTFYLPILDLGYRYQKPAGGFLFKAKIGILGLGFGLGYAFKSRS
ncbi:MAG: hypothetical protein ACO2Z9_10370 [Crocinitomicaceae bacterium]